MLQSEAKFFSGGGARPMEGRLEATSRNLLFISNSGEKVEIDYRRVVHISKISGELHIEISIANIKNASEKLILPGDDGYNTIVKYWSAHKPGVFNKLDHYFHGFNVKKAAIAFAAFFPVAALVYLTAFFNLYRIIPVSYDKSLGEAFYEQVEGYYQVCEDKALNQEVNKILEALPLDERFDFNITILNMGMVNAFALPGGRIIVTGELLKTADSPEELAAVLAHEAVHIEKRHSLQQALRTFGLHFVISVFVGGAGESFDVIESISEIGNLLLVLKYSRGFESEADREALQKLKKAKIDPGKFAIFFNRMKKIEDEMIKEAGIEDKGILEKLTFISTHPATEERLEITREFAAKHKGERWKRISSSRKWRQIRGNCKYIKEEKD